MSEHHATAVSPAESYLTQQGSPEVDQAPADSPTGNANEASKASSSPKKADNPPVPGFEALQDDADVPSTGRRVGFCTANGTELPRQQVVTTRVRLFPNKIDRRYKPKTPDLAPVRDLIALQDKHFHRAIEDFGSSLLSATQDVKKRSYSVRWFKDSPDDERYIPISAKFSAFKLTCSKNVAANKHAHDIFKQESTKVEKVLKDAATCVSKAIEIVTNLEYEEAITSRLRTWVVRLLTVIDGYVYQQRLKGVGAPPPSTWLTLKMNSVLLLKYCKFVLPEEYFSKYLKIKQDQVTETVLAIAYDITAEDVASLVDNPLPGQDRDIMANVFIELDKFLVQITQDLQREIDVKETEEKRASKLKAYMSSNRTKQATKATHDALEQARQQQHKQSQADAGPISNGQRNESEATTSNSNSSSPPSTAPPLTLAMIDKLLTTKLQAWQQKEHQVLLREL